MAHLVLISLLWNQKKTFFLFSKFTLIENNEKKLDKSTETWYNISGAILWTT